MINHVHAEKESDNMTASSVNEIIYNSEKEYFDYLLNIKLHDNEGNEDFCATFMTF